MADAGKPPYSKSLKLFTQYNFKKIGVR